MSAKEKPASAKLLELQPGNLVSAKQIANPEARNEPNARIIKMLKKALAQAKSGELQSLGLVKGFDHGDIAQDFELHRHQVASVIGMANIMIADMVRTELNWKDEEDGD